jgi:hypothetical protein
MNVNVSIGGIATSSRLRALALVREAMAKREQQLNDASTADKPNTGADPSSESPTARGR